MHLKWGCLCYAPDLSNYRDEKKKPYENHHTAPSYRQLLAERGPVVPFGSLGSSSDPVAPWTIWG